MLWYSGIRTPPHRGTPHALAHNHFDIVFLPAFFEGDYISVNVLAVNGHRLNALFNIRRILDAYIVGGAAELTCDLKVTEAVRYAGVNL